MKQRLHTDDDPRTLEFPLEMEVSDDGKHWRKLKIMGYLIGYVDGAPWMDLESIWWKHARLPQPKSFSAELAERGMAALEKDDRFTAHKLIQSLRIDSYMREFGHFLQHLEQKGIIEQVNRLKR